MKDWVKRTLKEVEMIITGISEEAWEREAEEARAARQAVREEYEREQAAMPENSVNFDVEDELASILKPTGNKTIPEIHSALELLRDHARSLHFRQYLSVRDLWEIAERIFLKNYQR